MSFELDHVSALTTFCHSPLKFCLWVTTLLSSYKLLFLLPLVSLWCFLSFIPSPAHPTYHPVMQRSKVRFQRSDTAFYTVTRSLSVDDIFIHYSWTTQFKARSAVNLYTLRTMHRSALSHSPSLPMLLARAGTDSYRVISNYKYGLV